MTTSWVVDWGSMDSNIDGEVDDADDKATVSLVFAEEVSAYEVSYAIVVMIHENVTIVKSRKRSCNFVGRKARVRRDTSDSRT